MPAPNMVGRYNTSLTSAEEKAFNEWALDQRSRTQRDVTADLFDYDIKGWWKEHGNVDLSDAHLEDKFKKPNHPTFSDESIYHGKDGHEGGKWGGDEKSGWTFEPGKTNRNMQSAEELQGYFAEREPNAKLLLPAEVQ